MSCVIWGRHSPLSTPTYLCEKRKDNQVAFYNFGLVWFRRGVDSDRRSHVARFTNL